MKQQILILANNSSGLMSFRKEVISGLVEQGYKVIVSVPDDPINSKISALNCKVIPVRNLNRRGTNPFLDFALYREYKKIMKRFNPDVVLTYTIKPNIYGGLAAKTKGIHYISNITGLGTAVEKPGLLQKLTIYLYKKALKDVQMIFFQNSANRDFFKEKIIGKKGRLIPGSGVNLEYHTFEDYPSDESKIKFIFIGRLLKEKGIEDYFACAERFKEKAEFHLLGECEEDYTNQLEELQERKVIIYHGKQNDVRPYIKSSHCLIHPTFYPEGMSNVILETAAAGRPVITTRRPGCKEAVDENITGFLFEEQNREQLFEKVERFLSMSNEDRARMGKRGRIKMENEFDRKIVVDAYLAEIEKILK